MKPFLSFFHSRGRRRAGAIGAGLVCALVGVAGCGSSETFEGRTSGDAIVVGS